MNHYIQKLERLGKEPVRIILGLMSGTSLDGLDLALCQFSGSGFHTKMKVLKFCTYKYDMFFREEIKKIFSKNEVNLELLTLLNEKVAIEHARIINATLSRWGISKDTVDVIASHGQTIYHAPFRTHQNPYYPNGTLQIGDLDHIAVNTGIITIGDFRQKHIAAGGEGAPLALYGDVILFSSKEKARILLNIGGIANFTYLPVWGSGHQIYCTDTGPGNVLLNLFANKYFGEEFDKDGHLSLPGKVKEDLLTKLLNHPFFKDPLPKTTGPELFNLFYIEQCLEDLDCDLQDVMATLCEFTVQSTVAAILSIREINPSETQIIVSGGGVHHPLIMQRLKYHLSAFDFVSLENSGVHPDAKEAVLFALLANEMLCGSRINLSEVNPSVCMGKISLPL